MSSNTVNVTRLIDERPVTFFQMRIFLLCALVVFLDGIDTQVIGIAAPVISRQMDIPRSVLGWIFSAGTLGATMGALCCGVVADRIGRKRMLVATTAVFGLATLATALANSFDHLVVLRFVTGLGLGGAVPCFVAMTSEYAPERYRATIVSLLWAAFPLGGMSGGFLNSYLIHLLPWQYLFYVWGVLPLVVAFALAIWLPESARFLLVTGRSQAAIRRIVDAIAPGSADATTTFVADDVALPGTPIRHLFDEGRKLQTLAIWIASFLVFGILTITAVWTPALLTSEGFNPSEAALVVGFNGLGSFLGTSSAGRLIERFGLSRCVIPGFILAAAATAYFGFAAHGLAAASLVSFIAGVFLGLSSSSIVALSATVYPTVIRSTGIGWGLGMGRLGSVLAPLAIGFSVSLGFSVSIILLPVGLSLLIAVPGLWLLSQKANFRRTRAIAV